jgi:hypothetical protein
MGHKGSISFSKEPSTWPSPEPDESSYTTHPSNRKNSDMWRKLPRKCWKETLIIFSNISMYVFTWIPIPLKGAGWTVYLLSPQKPKNLSYSDEDVRDINLQIGRVSSVWRSQHKDMLFCLTDCKERAVSFSLQHYVTMNYWCFYQGNII